MEPRAAGLDELPLPKKAKAKHKVKRRPSDTADSSTWLESNPVSKTKDEWAESLVETFQSRDQTKRTRIQSAPFESLQHISVQVQEELETPSPPLDESAPKVPPVLREAPSTSDSRQAKKKSTLSTRFINTVRDRRQSIAGGRPSVAISREEEAPFGTGGTPRTREYSHSVSVRPTNLALDDPMRQRKLIIDEIISTETQYVSDLKLIIDFFLEPLRWDKSIPKESLQTIFGNIEVIFQINSDLLADFKERQSIQGDTNIIVGDVFLKLVGFSLKRSKIFARGKALTHFVE